MKKYLLALALALGIAAPASAWDLAQMNRVIDQNNFIVNSGCSGTLISPDLVLTNYHCIDAQVQYIERDIVGQDGFVRKARLRRYLEVKLEQHGYSGFARTNTATYTADIVAEDKKKDLAIVRVRVPFTDRAPSQLLPAGSSTLRGERVYAVGNPAGYSATVVEGIISNVNRTYRFPWTGDEELPIIQFSGGIYGGNSGGALYNGAGYLIGVPAAMAGAANFIGLAIPSDIVKVFMRESCLASVFDPALDDKKCRDDKAAKENAQTRIAP